MLVRVRLVELVGMKEGRVNTHSANPRGARHSDVVEGVAEVGGLGRCDGMAESGETAAQRRRVRLLLHRVVAVNR